MNPAPLTDAALPAALAALRAAYRQPRSWGASFLGLTSVASRWLLRSRPQTTAFYLVDHFSGERTLLARLAEADVYPVTIALLEETAVLRAQAKYAEQTQPERKAPQPAAKRLRGRAA